MVTIQCYETFKIDGVGNKNVVIVANLFIRTVSALYFFATSSNAEKSRAEFSK